MKTQPPEGRREVMARFDRLTLSRDLAEVDWVKNPTEFSERLSAHLWTTSQVADFRTAAVEFLNTVRAAIPPPPPAMPRVSIVVLGQGVTKNSYPLFRRLRARHVLQPRGSRRRPANRVAADVGTSGAAPRSVRPLVYRRWLAKRHPSRFADAGISAGSIPSGTRWYRSCEACSWRARAPKPGGAR